MADIVVIPKGPFALVPEGAYRVRRKCFVWIVPSDGAWFETETRFLFDYDPAVIKPPSRIGLYLAMLKKLQKAEGDHPDLFSRCVSAYSKLGKLEKQIARAATNRNSLFVIQGRIEKEYAEAIAGK